MVERYGRYKSRYKEAYAQGARNLSITVSSQALQLMQDRNIGNFSAFINDLILDGLTEGSTHNFFLRLKIQEFNKLQRELEDLGYDSYLQPKKKEGV